MAGHASDDLANANQGFPHAGHREVLAHEHRPNLLETGGFRPRLHLYCEEPQDFPETPALVDHIGLTP